MFLPSRPFPHDHTGTLRPARASLAALAVAGLLALSACGGGDDTAESPETGAESSSAPAPATPPGEEPGAEPGALEPDLEGIPEVVAEVNGETIGRDEFVRAYESQFQTLAGQAQTTGQPVDQDALKQQTAETLVGNELLEQEADRLDISASNAAVKKEISSLLEQNNLGSKQELKPLLEQQGLTLKDLNEQVATQVRVTQLIAKSSPRASKVSDKEIRELYQQAKQQAGQAPEGQAQQVPPLKEVRSEIVSQIRQQKEGEAAQSLVADLRENADVTINL